MAAFSQSQLRLLAPVALVLFGIVFLVVVVASLDDPATSERERPASEARSSQPDRSREASSGGRSAAGKATDRVYVVKSGDTLAAIAERTDVPIDQLLSLNPSVDPQSLVTGQRIKLRE